MAGDDDRERVPGAGRPAGAHGARAASSGGDPGVALRLAVADVDQVAQDPQAEPAGEPEVQRHVERLAGAGEVLLELVGNQVESGRGVQDPRAELVDQLGEHRFVVLAVVGHPHQPLVGAQSDEQGSPARWW